MSVYGAPGQRPGEQRMKMSIDELKLAWNAQSDAMNQLDELGLDEIVDFAQEQMQRKAAEEIERLRGALRECADDLESEIQARAGGELPRRIARDMKPVELARALLIEEQP